MRPVPPAGDDPRHVLPAPGRRRTHPALLLPSILLCALPAPAQGGDWQRDPVPLPPGATEGTLTDIVEVAANDVWAVGWYRAPFGSSQEQLTLTAHHDGTAWSVVPSPSPRRAAGTAAFCALETVCALGSSDVYAAGTQDIATPYVGAQVLVLHWDGSAWQELPSPREPNASGGLVLDSLAEPDIGLVRFVGRYPRDPAGRRWPALSLVWDGSAFHQEALPYDPASTSGHQLSAIDRAPDGTLWACGIDGRFGASLGSYVVRRDANGWQEVALPVLAGARYELFDVDAARAPGQVWIVGTERPVGGSTRSVQFHFDGTRFERENAEGPRFALWSGRGDALHASGVGTAWIRQGDAWILDETFDNPPAGIGRIEPARGGGAWAAGSERVGGMLRPLAFRLDTSPSAKARIRTPCSTSAPPPVDALRVLAPPTSGGRLVLEVGDPQSTSGLPIGANNLAGVVLAAEPAPGYPCGRPLPGLGIGAGSGELLVDVTTALALPPARWSGPTSPARFTVPVPGDPALLGRWIFAQGLLTDGSAAVLTDGADLRFGL